MLALPAGLPSSPPLPHSQVVAVAQVLHDALGNVLAGPLPGVGVVLPEVVDGVAQAVKELVLGAVAPLPVRVVLGVVRGPVVAPVAVQDAHIAGLGHVLLSDGTLQQHATQEAGLLGLQGKQGGVGEGVRQAGKAKLVAC